MNDKDFNKKLLDIMEYAMGPEVMPGAMDSAPEQDRETENVTYSKTKSKGDASVTISANAKSMQELHDVLKLAGITLPKDKEINMEPEPEVRVMSDVCPQCGSADCECEPGECDCEPEGQEDPAYTTDKQAIIDRLRDTLKAKLIR